MSEPTYAVTLDVQISGVTKPWLSRFYEARPETRMKMLMALDLLNPGCFSFSEIKGIGSDTVSAVRETPEPEGPANPT